jgi:hypothetical protein
LPAPRGTVGRNHFHQKIRSKHCLCCELNALLQNGFPKEIRKISSMRDEVIVNARAIHAIMPSVTGQILRFVGDHEIATG